MIGYKIYNILRSRTFRHWLFLIFISGIIAILPDIDHVPWYLMDITYPLSFNILNFEQGRNLHSIIFIIDILSLSYFGGLLSWTILKKCR